MAKNETIITPRDTVRNITLNATIEVERIRFNKERDDFLIEDIIVNNKVFVRFKSDPKYDGQPLFLAEIGLRPYNKTREDDDDDEIVIPKKIEKAIPTLKELTLNERVILFGTLAAFVVYILKQKICPLACQVKTRLNISQVTNLDQDSDSEEEDMVANLDFPSKRNRKGKIP